MDSHPQILIVAAEASSELYAARVIEECQRRKLPVSFFGIGSPRMKALGCELMESSDNMAVVGLWEVLAHWSVISGAFKSLLVQAKLRKPKLALLLDYPDFNLRLAKKLNGVQIPVYYFISPQVWAWRTGRVNLIKKIIKKMLVVFPFEEPFYKSHGVDVTFVGHPFLDELPDSLLSPGEIEIGRSKRGVALGDVLIGLLPGSRKSELKHNFLTQLEAAKVIHTKNPRTKFMVVVAPSLDIDFVKTFIPEGFNIPFSLVKDEPLKLIQICDACIVASGTATLITALAGTPMVIMYKMNALTASIARKLVKGDFFGMPNLISGEKIVPELFQEAANPENLAVKILKFVDNKPYCRETRTKLDLVKAKLGSSGAVKKVVDEIEKELSGSQA